MSPKERRYRFSVHDSAGEWGDVEVTALDYDRAKWAAAWALTRLGDSALRVGFTLKLVKIR